MLRRLRAIVIRQKVLLLAVLLSLTAFSRIGEAQVPGQNQVRVTASADQCLGTNQPEGSAQRLTVGVVPQLPAAETLRRWSPFLERIGQSTNLCFVLTVSTSIPEFEVAFKQGVHDLAFMNPYHQVMAHNAQGYEPMLADTRLLTGIVVVAKESPIRNLSELQGADLSFPAPNAFAASLLIRSILAEQGIQFNARYVKTHTNVYRSVALGSAKAGGGVNNTLLREPESVRQALRILYETPGFRAHPFSAHRRVPETVRALIAKRILQMPGRPDEQKLLNDVQMPSPAPANHAKDYAPLQKMGIDTFVINEGSK